MIGISAIDEPIGALSHGPNKLVIIRKAEESEGCGCNSRRFSLQQIRLS